MEKVFKELGVEDKPRIEVLNKMDLLPESEQSIPADRGVAISAKTGEGLDDLLQRIDAALLLDPIVRQELAVPQDEGACWRRSRRARSSTRASFMARRCALRFPGQLRCLGVTGAFGLSE